MLINNASIGVAQKMKFKGEDRVSFQRLRNGALYVGIYDGHNGSGAASWCAQNMARLLDETYEDGESTVSVLKDAFMKAHYAIKDGSGTTASLLISYGEYIVVAHVGDSRVVVCHKGTAVTITEDHRCDWEAERVRIEAAEREANRQLLIGNRIDGLMITRSIGDHGLCHAIVPHPVVHEFIRSPEDEYIILATDGLWDVCNGSKAVEILKRHKLSSTTEKADALVHYASQQYRARQLRGDDITCCVVHFRQPGIEDLSETGSIHWSFDSMMEKEFYQ